MPQSAERDVQGDSQSPATYTRRSALKRGAAVGGALAWAVPVVSVISMSSANAESPSAPPRTPPETTPDTPDSPKTTAPPAASDTPTNTGTGGGTPGGGKPGGAQPVGGPLKAINAEATPAPAATSGPQSLAYTGFPTTEAVVGGAGLLAAGVALTVASNTGKNAAPEPDAH